MTNNIAYHYTSLANWQTIKHVGLEPYLIKKPEFLHIFPDGFKGIWMWKKDLKGIENFGSIIWQVGTKKDLVIVKLKVAYDEDKVLKFNRQNLSISHEGNIGDLKFHQSTASVIVTERILPHNIQLVKTYDLLKLIQ